MQDAAERFNGDLYAEARRQLLDPETCSPEEIARRERLLEEAIAELRAPLHPNCYLSPSQFAEKFGLGKGSDPSPPAPGSDPSPPSGEMEHQRKREGSDPVRGDVEHERGREGSDTGSDPSPDSTAPAHASARPAGPASAPGALPAAAASALVVVGAAAAGAAALAAAMVVARALFGWTPW